MRFTGLSPLFSALFPSLLLSLLLPLKHILFAGSALYRGCVFKGLAAFLEMLSSSAWRHPRTRGALRGCSWDLEVPGGGLEKPLLLTFREGVG